MSDTRFHHTFSVSLALQLVSLLGKYLATIWMRSCIRTHDTALLRSTIALLSKIIQSQWNGASVQIRFAHTRTTSIKCSDTNQLWWASGSVNYLRISRSANASAFPVRHDPRCHCLKYFTHTSPTSKLSDNQMPHNFDIVHAWQRVCLFCLRIQPTCSVYLAARWHAFRINLHKSAAFHRRVTASIAWNTVKARTNGEQIKNYMDSCKRMHPENGVQNVQNAAFK